MYVAMASNYLLCFWATYGVMVVSVLCKSQKLAMYLHNPWFILWIPMMDSLYVGSLCIP